MKFRTAEDIDDIDIVQEINSYANILNVDDRSNMYHYENKFKDADFYIQYSDQINKSSLDKIYEKLKFLGYKAYLENVDTGKIFNNFKS
jgi:hypothetical protein